MTIAACRSPACLQCFRLVSEIMDVLLFLVVLIIINNRYERSSPRGKVYLGKVYLVRIYTYIANEARPISIFKTSKYRVLQSAVRSVVAVVDDEQKGERKSALFRPGISYLVSSASICPRFETRSLNQSM